MKIFFPPGWTLTRQREYLETRGLRSMGLWTLRCFYPDGIFIGCPVVDVITCWTPDEKEAA